MDRPAVPSKVSSAYSPGTVVVTVAGPAGGPMEVRSVEAVPTYVDLGTFEVAAGEFGAHMRVSLVNDGPVTFWLRMPPDDKELTVAPGA